MQYLRDVSEMSCGTTAIMLMRLQQDSLNSSSRIVRITADIVRHHFFLSQGYSSVQCSIKFTSHLKIYLAWVRSCLANGITSEQCHPSTRPNPFLVENNCPFLLENLLLVLRVGWHCSNFLPSGCMGVRTCIQNFLWICKKLLHLCCCLPWLTCCQAALATLTFSWHNFWFVWHSFCAFYFPMATWYLLNAWYAHFVSIHLHFRESGQIHHQQLTYLPTYLQLNPFLINVQISLLAWIVCFAQASFIACFCSFLSCLRTPVYVRACYAHFAHLAHCAMSL